MQELKSLDIRNNWYKTVYHIIHFSCVLSREDACHINLGVLKRLCIHGKEPPNDLPPPTGGGGGGVGGCSPPIFFQMAVLGQTYSEKTLDFRARDLTPPPPPPPPERNWSRTPMVIYTYSLHLCWLAWNWSWLDPTRWQRACRPASSPRPGDWYALPRPARHRYQLSSNTIKTSNLYSSLNPNQLLFKFIF